MNHTNIDEIKRMLHETSLDEWGKRTLKWKRSVAYKHYLRFKKIPLPKGGESEIEKCIRRRRSIKNFGGARMSLAHLGRILLHGCGRSTKDKNSGEYLRMYPSAGARYPLEIYVIVLRQQVHLEKGVYHYNPFFHVLEKISGDVPSRRILRTIFNQGDMEVAPLLFVITAVPIRTASKYGLRSFRYMLIEAGHMAQNIYLMCTALRIHCCAVGAFVDKELGDLLYLDREQEFPIYVLVVGK